MKPKITVIVPVYNSEEWLQRALDSIPRAKDIQIILLDDGSTDRSWEIMLKWWRDNYIEGSRSVIHRSNTNHGVAQIMNLGFNMAQGEYIVSLSSDDYYLTDFEPFRKYMDGENDLIFFNLEVNDGSIWHVNETNIDQFVGAVKFIRRAFLGGIRIPNLKYKEDKPFSLKLYKQNPKCVFTDIALKHYNWPREGSIIWQAQHDHDRENAEDEARI